MQLDFFVANIVDAAAKDDLVSMEHPLFALRAGDKRTRHYTRAGASVSVKPGQDGCATIHDKDIWIYCISQVVESINRGRQVSRTVRFTAYDYLTATNRDASGRAYERLIASLSRLKGTVIETDLETAGQHQRAGFGLLDAWRVIERTDDGRMVAVEVTLPDWLWRSVMDGRVLTLNEAYFRLRKPLDRRIYELARKHCGMQPSWRIKISTLLEKSGSTGSVREFRRQVKELVDSAELPDYRAVFDSDNDVVTFYSKSLKGEKAQLAEVMSSYAKHVTGQCEKLGVENVAISVD